MVSLYATLRAAKSCPVCGTPAMPGSREQQRLQLIRFQCGAVFSVDAAAGVINANDPCPSPSQVAVAHLMLERAMTGAA